MGCSHSCTAISCGSAADEERRRVQNRCIRRLIHQLSTLRKRVSITEQEASAQLSSFLSGSVRRRGLRKAPKQRVDACCAQPKSVDDFQLVVCGAVVKGDAVLISDKRDKQHFLCTATQSFSTVIGSAAKGWGKLVTCVHATLHATELHNFPFHFSIPCDAYHTDYQQRILCWYIRERNFMYG